MCAVGVVVSRAEPTFALPLAASSMRWLSPRRAWTAPMRLSNIGARPKLGCPQWQLRPQRHLRSGNAEFAGCLHCFTLCRRVVVAHRARHWS